MGIAPLALALSATLGCREPDPEPPDPTSEPSETAETGTPTDTWTSTDTGTTTPGPFTADCAPQTSNALRFECAIHVDVPQPVAVSFARVDGLGPVRTHRSDEALSDHTVGLYLMAPATAYEWTASLDAPGTDPALQPISGRLTTSPLPMGLAQLQFDIEGVSTAPAIGFASPCADGAFVVVADPATGEVLWYQDFALTLFGFLDAVTFSEQGTVLAIVDGSVQELDRMGNTLASLSPGNPLPFRSHHDVFRRDDRIYALFQELAVFGGAEYLMDGFYVIEGGALIAEWHLQDHVVPPPNDMGFPLDWSHANAVWVDEGGKALISFRHLSAVMEVIADPDQADFGAVRWTMAAPGSDLDSDLAIASEIGPPEDFQQQHNVFLLPDGRMTLFDNRLDPDELSRVLELRVDLAGGVATLERAFQLPVHCPFQGGALRTPAGNPLATCAPFAQAFEYDAVTGAQQFDMQLTCSTGFGRYVPRFVPVSW
jgi:hypothetical protein